MSDETRAANDVEATLRSKIVEATDNAIKAGLSKDRVAEVLAHLVGVLKDLKEP
jgi:hypothetical protein